MFLDRLGAAPAVASHGEAFALLAAVLNAIEDEHSGVLANPANWQFDERMYPPQSDMARASADMPGVTIYRSRAHRTLIARNGALAITDAHTGAVLLEKSGQDGVGVWPKGSGKPT